ncbi:glycosyltransferase [Proteiniclasticum sp. SCR006]|uniref:Glycosyltransferase n=1 Tax=Proteiniclasticum aestuarii TaxID=2817862 RepID=A0A939KKP6_9CLOT|nr:glycosyltransferase [Proteiniclasticum aestuarii]MBO1266326.1 glycosyltransferase [Proteiniclasticum aestuarii]
MKILIIPSWYPSHRDSLEGIFFKEQAIALKKDDNKVFVVVPPKIYSMKKIFNSDVNTKIENRTENGIVTIRSNDYAYIPKSKLASMLFMKRKFIKMIEYLFDRYGKPDIIHAHSFIWGGVLGAYISKKYNIPIVLTEHSTAFSRDMITNIQKKAIRSANDIINEIIVVGPGLSKDLKPYIGDRSVKIVPNIVNINEFKLEENIIKNKDGDDFTFLCIGLLTYKKRVDLLISAFSKMKNQKCKLLIGGDGEEKENLMSLTQTLKIENRVRFLGRLSRDQVKKQMRECSVFVLASRHETFGIVFIEALASGKPIIATRSGGPNNIVNDFNGVLIDVDNEEQLTDSMDQIISNYSKYNPIEIRQDCINRFSEDTIVNKLKSIYMQHIAKKSKLGGDNHE